MLVQLEGLEGWWSLTREQKIRTRQLAAPELSGTLQELCINELKEKKHVATEGLLWLTRYVLFPTSFSV
jgi:hypothetical protein